MVISINPNEALQIMKEGKAFAVDVRTKEEFEDGHIASAENVDFYNPDFQTNIQVLPKDKKYIVNCRSGGRSAKACEFMASVGYDVVNLEGGITAWNALGLPVEK